MFLNKFLLIGGGLAVAGAGTGLGIYYGVQSRDDKKPKGQDAANQNPDARSSESSLSLETGGTSGDSLSSGPK